MRISDWSSDVCSSDLLGLVQANCAVLILSNSGETSELSDLIHYCQVYGIITIALTANPNSTLARNATATIAYGKVTEVCPNGLAPTKYTTLSLAIGDALAVGLTHMLGTERQSTRMNASHSCANRMTSYE